MRIFSADPGTKNFAFAITEHVMVNGKMRSKIIGTGMLNKALTKLNGDIVKDIKAFERELVAIRNKYKPDLAAFERFQSRGLKGTTIECINMMLTIMVQVFSKQSPKLLLASTWKNRVNKRVDLKAAYKDYGLSRKRSPKTPHELDATLIGFYIATRYHGMTDFQNFTEENWNAFMEWFLTRPKL